MHTGTTNAGKPRTPARSAGSAAQAAQRPAAARGSLHAYLTAVGYHFSKVNIHQKLTPPSFRCYLFGP